MTSAPDHPTSDLPVRVPAALGALLGLAVLKFGNPVILDTKVGTPETVSEFWLQPWPLRWSIPLLLALGVGFLVDPRVRRLISLRTVPLFAWALPIAWLGWQFIAGQASVDPSLSHVTLAHFTAIVGGYLIGVSLLGRSQGWTWILPGLGVAAVFCWLRAVNQHLVEFPQDHATLLAGQQNGWTNFPPKMVNELRQNGLIVLTNGVEIANPAIVDKLRQGRVYGTLVYPNALASCVLLLLPVLVAGTVRLARQMRPALGRLLIGLVAAPGLAGLFWSGSKSGWLIAIGSCGLALLWVPQIHHYRRIAVTALVLVGLVVFGARFSGYFARGATSVSARLDYWRAAVQITADHSVLGTGPGTFQRPYARMKSPGAEMARLTHNDYLEQFCDSGVVGGVLYLGWIIGVLGWLWRRPPAEPLLWSATLGVTAWLAHGVVEFGLYVPALAWTAFTLLGVLVGARGIASTPGGWVAKPQGKQ